MELNRIIQCRYCNCELEDLIGIQNHNCGKVNKIKWSGRIARDYEM